MATYAELFWGRLESDRIKIPKAVEQGFAVPQNDQERNIQEAIDRFKLQQASQLEQELFKQRKRLADAQRSLLAKPTKAATEAQRISTNKIGWVMSKLADLRRTELAGQDSRIYPGYYAPVMIFENGERVVKPMRYQGRPAGKPVAYDNKYPGTYNARRDNLEGFWKGQFWVHPWRHGGECLLRACFPTRGKRWPRRRQRTNGKCDSGIQAQTRAEHAGCLLVVTLEGAGGT